MLGKINSKYILKFILSNITEKIKLKLVNYNKNLQAIINKNIINYKIFSGKYITHETIDKIKIYNAYDDKLMLEGGFSDGKINGIVREYDDKERLIFEGEYLKGKRNGKGKVFYSNGQLRFEGEYLNGKFWNIKEYDSNNKIINEIKNGKGLINQYNSDGKLLHQFYIINGIKNGEVKKYYSNGSLSFEGEYLNGEKNGKGREYYKNGKIKSEIEYLNGNILNMKEYDFNYKIINELKEGKGYIMAI